MICRPVLVSCYGGGTEGIRVYIQKPKDEFSDAMYMCGARKVSDIDGNMIRLTKSKKKQSIGGGFLIYEGTEHCSVPSVILSQCSSHRKPK